MGPQAKRRKITTSTVEEVNFDPTAREDYLTGFHKRKVQRIKQAQEHAVKRAREERIEERKKVCTSSQSYLKNLIFINVLLSTDSRATGSRTRASYK